MMKCFLLLAILLVIPLPGFAALPRLHVEGNTLKAADGSPVTLRGVSLCSLSWTDPVEFIKTLGSGEGGWHPDVIRLPVQPAEWERIGPGDYIAQHLDPAIRECRRNGVYCIVDWHEISDWNDAIVAGKLESFWRIIAPRYKDDPFVLYEIFNEPKAPGDRTRENWLAFRARAQKWVDMVRAKAPDTVLLIGSPFWSQMPGFAVQDPFRGDNLVYVLHLYHGWSPDTWDDLFGNAARAIPLFVSEWGWSSLLRNRLQPFYGTRAGYAAPLRAYLDARPQISWTAWSYDPECGPAMIGKDKDMGAFVREWLSKYGKTPPRVAPRPEP
jgi:endoglucanase